MYISRLSLFYISYSCLIWMHARVYILLLLCRANDWGLLFVTFWKLKYKKWIVWQKGIFIAMLWERGRGQEKGRSIDCCRGQVRFWNLELLVTEKSADKKILFLDLVMAFLMCLFLYTFLMCLVMLPNKIKNCT